jgi:hypothetical protein
MGTVAAVRSGSARMRRVASMPSMSRHVQVHQHQVEALPLHGGDGFLAAGHEVAAVAHAVQQRASTWRLTGGLRPPAPAGVPWRDAQAWPVPRPASQRPRRGVQRQR